MKLQKLRCLGFFAACILSVAAWGATRTWTGLGDGSTFGDADNWDAAVQAEDDLVIESPTAGTTLELVNDLGSAESPIRLNSINVFGKGTVRISGNPIEPSSGNNKSCLLVQCGLVTDFDINFPNHVTSTLVHLTVTNKVTWTHNGIISAPGKTEVHLNTSGGVFQVYGDLSITNGSVEQGWTGNSGNNNSRWHFHGMCKVLKWNTSISASSFVRGEAYFYRPYNEIATYRMASKTYISCPDAFHPSTCLASGTYAASSVGAAGFVYPLYDFTVDRIFEFGTICGFKLSAHGVDGAGTTLTMASTCNTTSDYRFVSSVNVVYAPKGDFTYTGRARTNSTTGCISVKRGTMKFLNQVLFTGLSELEIDPGATFSLAEATDPSPFRALKRIWLGNTSTAVLALPEGCSVPDVAVFNDGIPLAAGTYTGTGGTADNIVDWISGKGVVTVVAPQTRHFTGAVDTSWGNTGNWTGGTLPANDTATYICGGNTVVTVPPSVTSVYDLASFAANDTTPSFTVSRGGKLSVTGGKLVITNICGKARLGWNDPSVTSRIEVTGGFLGMYATRGNSFLVGKGGVLSMTGGTFYYRYLSERGWRFRMSNGAIDLSGDSVFNVFMEGLKTDTCVFGTGTVDVRDNAQLRFPGTGTRRQRWTPDAPYGTLTLNFSGNSSFYANSDADYIGGSYTGATTVVNASGNAVLRFGSAFIVGYGGGLGGAAGARCELNISEHAVVSNASNYGIFIARNGSAANPSWGKVKMTGGYLRTRATQSGDYYGLAIGCDDSETVTGIYNRGTLEILGGAVTNTESATHMIVGMGNSYGEILQSGGIFSHEKNYAYVGWRGGTGLYRFTGGKAVVRSTIFGIGVDGGKGTLEIGSGEGTFTAKNLTLGGADSVLKFKPGADGSLATLDVENTLTINEGAKLVVDVTEYAGTASVNLMTFGSKTGTFAEEDITILSAHPSDYRVLQTASRLRLARYNGMMMIVR